jgi:hypothetical protein
MAAAHRSLKLDRLKPGKYTLEVLVQDSQERQDRRTRDFEVVPEDDKRKGDEERRQEEQEQEAPPDLAPGEQAPPNLLDSTSAGGQ